MSKVDLRQSVNLAFILANGTEAKFNMPIYVQFVPDEVIVRQLTAMTTTDTGNILQIATNLVTDQIIASFVHVSNKVTPDAQNVPQNIQLENHFQLKRAINGRYEFQVQVAPTNVSASSGTGPGVITSSCDGVIQLLLEFVKYKD